MTLCSNYVLGARKKRGTTYTMTKVAQKNIHK